MAVVEMGHQSIALVQLRVIKNSPHPTPYTPSPSPKLAFRQIVVVRTIADVRSQGMGDRDRS